MKYDITTNKAPEMSALGKGTECIKLLLSQASNDMHAPSFRCFSPLLAHVYVVRNFSTQTSLGKSCVAKWHTS